MSSSTSTSDDGSTSKGDRAEVGEVNLAQIMADLRKGEKTADVLETNLNNLEKKLDDLLASFEESDRAKVEGAEHTKVSESEKGDDAKA